MLARDCVVLGDLHLTRHSPRELGLDLARLFERHMNSTVVVAGDLFDLVLDRGLGRSGEPTRPDSADRARAIAEVLGVHAEARAALGRFLDAGGELVLIGGNHDADVAYAREAMLDAIDVANDARGRLCVSPWFWRHGGLHVEHGHFYDPDNAPAHPLVRGEPSLGVHFSAEFMRATQAHRYLSTNDAPPLQMFLSAFRWYGLRAPYVIYRYFHAAFGALAKSGPFYRAHGERELGAAAQLAFASEAGIPLELLERMLGLGARSTLESFAATFARLYLDRAGATIMTAAGLGAFAKGRPASGGALVTLGSLLMLSSWFAGHDRYGGQVVDRLRAAAGKIGETTGAQLVVFGHTHREALEQSYANTGSFGFPREAPGRPYLVIEASGRPVRRYLAA